MFSQVEFPEKMRRMFTPGRYKIFYGGRGGGKSHSIAKGLLIQGIQEKHRILCAREVQGSIRDSVHKLLSDQIISMGLQDFYEIQQSAIYGKNGTEFLFAGLRHNISSVKSMEGCTRVWVEEAQTVSKASWNVLIPTIRKDGSEIWVSFNPELEEDETYQRFVLHPPAGAIVERINWSDNPWFPTVLQAEKDALQERDHAAYLNVWEGHCRRSVDGAIFASELELAELEGRIGNVKYDPAKPVHRIWDLGWADNVAIWFLQMVGMEYRLIRYIEGNQKTMAQWLAECQQYGYVYDTDWLPHDAQNKTLAANGRSIEEIVRSAGAKVRIIPRTSIVSSIEAAKNLFRNCWFDREHCADGIACLRHYQYDVDPDTKMRSREPLHNWASHGADAFRMMGLMVQEPRKARPKRAVEPAMGWMS